MPTSAPNSAVILSKYLPFSGPQFFSESILWTSIPTRCLVERQAFFPMPLKGSHQQRNLFHPLLPKPFLKHRTRHLQELSSSSKMLWSTLSSPAGPPQELAPPSSPLSQKPYCCSGLLGCFQPPHPAHRQALSIHLPVFTSGGTTPYLHSAVHSQNSQSGFYK